MKLYYSPYQLFTKHPFGTAHGTRDYTDVIFVAITHNGFIGYGEASLPPYYGESIQTVRAFFDLIDINQLAQFDNIENAMFYVDQLRPGNPAAKAAIDIALHDWWGKKKGISIRSYYEINSKQPIYTCYTIGIDSIEGMLQKVGEAGVYKILKIKLDGQNDVAIIKAIVQVTNQRLFVDANQSWKDIDQAITDVKILAALGVELVEQPFPKGEFQKNKILRFHSPIPVVADEDCQRFPDIKVLAEYFDGVNIKLMKSIGIAEAYKMIKVARASNLKIFLGCMSESSVAISAAAQLAPLADWCDLDGNLLISNDPSEGVYWKDGLMVYPNSPGIGITNDKRLRELLKLD